VIQKGGPDSRARARYLGEERVDEPDVGGKKVEVSVVTTKKGPNSAGEEAVTAKRMEERWSAAFSDRGQGSGRRSRPKGKRKGLSTSRRKLGRGLQRGGMFSE